MPAIVARGAQEPEGRRWASPSGAARSQPMSTSSTRRLAAVMIADVAGYSRLMEHDEAGTHARLLEIRDEVTDPAVRGHGGRIVRTVGDGILVEFPSAASALAAAVEIQRTMARRNLELPADQRVDHRIGINLGDILVDEHDIAGTGVNVAARLEALAPPGGIAISGTVREQVREDIGVRFVDAGEQQVKNISRPIRVFRVEIDGAPSPWTRLRAARWRRPLTIAAGTVVLVIAATLAHRQWQPEKPPQSLVILPFAFADETPGGAVLAASMTAQVTRAVSRVTGLAVIAPAVAAPLAGRRGELRQIGDELKVRYALDGRVDRSANLVRVTAHLVDTGSGGSLWSSDVEAPAAADGSAPLAVIGRLSETLRSAVIDVELKRVAAGEQASSAYALALAASRELQDATELAQIRAARERFERALALEPGHVPALTGYAHALVFEADRIDPGTPRDGLLAKADEVSLRAVTLQTDNAEAWGARANVLLFRNRIDAAVEAIQRALELNPYLITVQSFSGQIYLAQGRGEEALAAFDRGIELNPTSTARGVLMHFRCRALLLLGRYAQAIESCERGMAFGTEWPDYMVLAAAYALHGDAPRAAQARAGLLRLQPAFTIRWHEALAGRAGAAHTPFERVLHEGLRMAAVPE